MLFILLLLFNVSFGSGNVNSKHIQTMSCLDYYIQCDRIFSNHLWFPTSYHQLTNRHICIDFFTVCKHFDVY